MTRLAVDLIALVTPVADRESVVGDTVERYEELLTSAGSLAARRWLWREVARVLRDAPRHRLAARTAPSAPQRGRRGQLMSSLGQDVRYAARWFGRSPGFTAVAVLTLALGIGANTAMFAVVNAVLLKPLPFADADRLMLVHLLAPRREGDRTFGEVVWSYPKYRTFVEVQQSFEETALFSDRAFTLSGDGEPERLRGEVITDQYLRVLGVALGLGRTFTADEAHQAGAAPVALLGHGVWTRRYGADPAILGRSIRLSGVEHTIVGVLPHGFRGLNGNAEIWTPLAVTEAWSLKEPLGHNFMMVGLRRPDVSESAAMAAVQGHGAQIDERFRDRPNDTPWGASAVSLEASRVDSDLRRGSLVVFGAVGFVLLIACVNLTNLLVARAVARAREVAVRVALGAGRARIARQFGIEGLLLAGAGALGGVVVAAGLLALAAAILPDADVFFRSAVTPGTRRIAGAAGLTRIGAGLIGLDAATLLFSAGAAVLTAILVSILPAWQASKARPAQSLKLAGATAATRGAHGFRSRSLLVAVEIALALVLLAGSGLMLKSADHLQRTALGIDPVDVTTVGIELQGAAYNADRGRVFHADVMARVAALPGVETLGLGSCLPVSGGCNATTIRFLGRPPTPNNPVVGVLWATPGYFDVLRVRLVHGRNFADGDRMGQPKVALVNEAAARAFWPNASAIGQRIAVGQGGFNDGAEVVGVVADVRYRAIETAATPDVYLPLAQSYRGTMRLFVRSPLDTASLVTAIRREVQALDANLPLVSVKTMDESIGDAMWRTRVAGWLLSAFAGLALLLTSIGVFGVMAQTVTQRTPEFGLRMALGAQRADVLALVLRRAFVVTACGLAIGLVAAVALTRMLTALLYDVAPGDPATLGAVAVVLGVVSLAAAYVPARRAVRVDPTRALKSE
jgi:predicted permease